MHPSCAKADSLPPRPDASPPRGMAGPAGSSSPAVHVRASGLDVSMECSPAGPSADKAPATTSTLDATSARAAGGADGRRSAGGVLPMEHGASARPKEASSDTSDGEHQPAPPAAPPISPPGSGPSGPKPSHNPRASPSFVAYEPRTDGRADELPASLPHPVWTPPSPSPVAEVPAPRMVVWSAMSALPVAAAVSVSEEPPGEGGASPRGASAKASTASCSISCAMLSAPGSSDRRSIWPPSNSLMSPNKSADTPRNSSASSVRLAAEAASSTRPSADRMRESPSPTRAVCRTHCSVASAGRTRHGPGCDTWLDRRNAASPSVSVAGWPEPSEPPSSESRRLSSSSRSGLRQAHMLGASESDMTFRHRVASSRSDSA
mmetsp:Transcript_8123/g.26786  ORF Transcript_8123/g.26786 Transcript_8123/m.26786 type:complete len:377 (+) Transcript_8123:1236-2366(+)